MIPEPPSLERVSHSIRRSVQRSTRIRPFMEEDIPRVAELHGRTFGGSARGCTREAYPRYFKDIFLHNPWADDDIPSLVYEHDGRIEGFLGVMPRRMRFGGEVIRAAISSQFMVEPGSHAAVAALELLKAFLSGPQELSLADEANNRSRKLWEALGGSTALLYSVHWCRPLRPSRLAVSLLQTHQGLSGVARTMDPLCRVIDAFATRLAKSPFCQAGPRMAGEELGPEELLRCLDQYGRGCALRPDYDRDSLAWLLAVARQKEDQGVFSAIGVRNEVGEILGWYLYCNKPGGMGEIIQIGADSQGIQPVLDHLFFHAWSRGAVSLQGRLDPRFLQEIWWRRCFFQHRGYWTLVHAKTPAVLQAIHRGDALLSRLEGEWCLRFSAPRL